MTASKFKCYGCGLMSQEMPAACVGCHKPLCLRCLRRSRICKYCNKEMKDKNEDMLYMDDTVAARNRGVSIREVPGRCFLIEVYDTLHAENTAVVLDVKKLMSLNEWIKKHV